MKQSIRLLLICVSWFLLVRSYEDAKYPQCDDNKICIIFTLDRCTYHGAKVSKQASGFLWNKDLKCEQATWKSLYARLDIEFTKDNLNNKDLIRFIVYAFQYNKFKEIRIDFGPSQLVLGKETAKLIYKGKEMLPFTKPIYTYEMYKTNIIENIFTTYYDRVDYQNYDISFIRDDTKPLFSRQILYINDNIIQCSYDYKEFADILSSVYHYPVVATAPVYNKTVEEEIIYIVKNGTHPPGSAEERKENLSAGAVAGIVIGVIVIIALLAGIVYVLFMKRRRRRRKRSHKSHSKTSSKKSSKRKTSSSKQSKRSKSTKASER